MTTAERIADARIRKAQKIAAVLRSRGYQSGDVIDLDVAGRSTAARLAGVPMPSESTWALVVDLLEARP